MSWKFNPFTGNFDFSGGEPGPPGAGGGAPATVYADDYGGNLITAINATPAGGRLVLGTGVYNGTSANGQYNFILNRSDITIEGVNQPRYSDDGNALVGGSIVRGPLLLRGNGIRVHNVGIDCGPTWFAAAQAAQPSLNKVDGLGCYTDYLSLTANDDPNHSLEIDSVVVLAPAYNNDAHAVVLVNYSEVFIKNLQTRNGIWGLVTKCREVFIDGLRCENHGRSAFYPKSNNYGIQSRLVGSNIYVKKDLALASLVDSDIGVNIHAADANLDRVALSNVFVEGHRDGIALFAWNGVTVSDVAISGAVVHGYSNYGVVTYHDGFAAPPVTTQRFKNVKLSDITTDSKGEGGRSMSCTAENLMVSNVVGSSDTELSDNIYLGGSPLVSNIISCVGGRKKDRSGLVIAPAPDSVGPYIAHCSGLISDYSPVLSAEDFIDRRQAFDNASLEGGVRDAYLDLAAALVDAGLWDRLDVIGIPFGARTLSGGLVPMKGPFNVAENLVSGDFSRSAGIQGNNTNKRLLSRFGDSDYSLNSFSMATDVSVAGTVTARVIVGWGTGTAGASNITTGHTNPAGVSMRNQSSGRWDQVVANTGFFGSTRQDSATFIGYTEDTQSTRSVASSTTNIYSPIGILGPGLNLASYTDAAVRFWCWGDGLTDAEMLALRSAYITCRTAVLAAIP